MRAQGTSGERPPELPDREVWRRGQKIEVPLDANEYLLELAAFADNRLDEDETARVAALIARDAAVSDDVAAARSLADATMTTVDEQIVARASLLVGGARADATVIAFPARQPVVRPWYSAATWSGLAAAIAFASWLGFDLGSGLSSAPPFGHPTEDVSVNELLDATPPLLPRDFTENSQI
jgi:hypothetical protein